jgi:hypothetical protein
MMFSFTALVIHTGTADVETVPIGLKNRLAQTLFHFLGLLVCI